MTVSIQDTADIGLSARERKLALLAGATMSVYLVLQMMRTFLIPSGTGNLTVRTVIAACHLLAVFFYFLFFHKATPRLAGLYLLLSVAATGFFLYEVWVLYSAVTNFAVVNLPPRVSQILFPAAVFPFAAILWKHKQIPRAFALLQIVFAVVWLSMYFYAAEIAVLVDLAFLCDFLGVAAIGGFAIWMVGVGSGVLEWSPSRAQSRTHAASA